MSRNECDGGYWDHLHTNRTRYRPNYHVRLLFIYFAPNFEKVDGHIAFGACVGGCVTFFVPTVTFKP